MTMKDLVEVFQDTLRIADSIPNNSETEKYDFEWIIENPGSSSDNVRVVGFDGVTALQEWSKRDKRMCILNMASFKRPGGGVERGAKAQEEGLFRCSNLFRAISNEFYPLEKNECLYTQDATFFKDFLYEPMDPIETDVITLAAINYNVEGTVAGPDSDKLTRQKMRLMLSIPANHGVKVLILGAWGCGVFKNDPVKIATQFKEVLNEGYSGLYDEVIFAIINDHNSVANNLQIFKEEFK